MFKVQGVREWRLNKLPQIKASQNGGYGRTASDELLVKPILGGWLELTLRPMPLHPSP